MVLVNDWKSSLLTVEFGVQQGSVLGPMFFNLYVADLQEKLQLPSYQYADDTSVYIHSKVCDLDSAVKEVNDAILESLSRRRFCQHGRQPEVNRAVIDGEWMRQPFSFEINNGSHSAFTFVISNENG